MAAVTSSVPAECRQLDLFFEFLSCGASAAARGCCCRGGSPSLPPAPSSFLCKRFDLWCGRLLPDRMLG